MHSNIIHNFLVWYMINNIYQGYICKNIHQSAPSIIMLSSSLETFAFSMSNTSCVHQTSLPIIRNNTVFWSRLWVFGCCRVAGVNKNPFVLGCMWCTDFKIHGLPEHKTPIFLKPFPAFCSSTKLNRPVGTNTIRRGKKKQEIIAKERKSLPLHTKILNFVLRSNVLWNTCSLTTGRKPIL